MYHFDIIHTIGRILGTKRGTMFFNAFCVLFPVLFPILAPYILATYKKHPCTCQYFTLYRSFCFSMCNCPFFYNILPTVSISLLFGVFWWLHPQTPVKFTHKKSNDCSLLHLYMNCMYLITNNHTFIFFAF